jgi:hypothetical protein
MERPGAPKELFQAFWAQIVIVAGGFALVATVHSDKDAWDGNVSLPKFALDLAIVALAASWLLTARYFKQRNTALGALQNARLSGEVPASGTVMLGKVRAGSLEDMIASGRVGPVNVNPAALDEYGIYCKIVDVGGHLHGEITFTLKGRNLKDSALVKVIIPVCADLDAPFPALKVQYFDLLRDPNRTQGRPARPYAKVGARQDIEMNFDDTVIPAHEKFWIEMKLTWPSFFTGVDDYLFLDTAPFERVERAVVELDLSKQSPAFVEAYSVGRDRHVDDHYGQRDAPNGIHRFERAQPKKDTFYALTVQW